MNKTAKFIIFDILKNKIVVLYTLILFLVSWSVLGLEENVNKAILSLLNVVILLVPLVSVIFSTIYVYNSSQFIELLLSQPVARGGDDFGVFIRLCVADITLCRYCYGLFTNYFWVFFISNFCGFCNAIINSLQG